MADRVSLQLIVIGWRENLPGQRVSVPNRKEDLDKVVRELKSHGYTFKDLEMTSNFDFIVNNSYNPGHKNSVKRGMWKDWVKKDLIAVIAEVYKQEIDENRKTPIEEPKPKAAVVHDIVKEDVFKSIEIPNTLENPLDFSQLPQNDFKVIYDEEYAKLLGLKK